MHFPGFFRSAHADYFSGMRAQNKNFFWTGVLFLSLSHLAPPVLAEQSDPLTERLSRLSPLEMDEVLWLARCVYSETNRADEQRLVAWVVRNRVDTNYRGETYREVVLEPLQFSAFNTSSPRRSFILGLNQNSPSEAWRQALEIALDIYQADPIDRPFSIETRHFYSPISMAGNRPPDWARNARPLNSEALGADPHRFLFFEEIDESADPFLARNPTPKDRIDSFQSEARERLQPVSTRKKAPLRERMKLSGRVKRPARPRTNGTKRTGW